MTKVCICQICTCGRHRCPHHPTNTGSKGAGACLLTEYNNKYKQHPLEARQAFKPAHKPVATDQPIDDKTTHKVDYVPHPPSKPPQHQPEEYKAPEGETDHLTTYVKDYPGKRAERVAPVKHDLTRKSPGRFEGEPTYKVDYRKWTPTLVDRKRHESGYRPPSAAFQGNTNYQTDYLTHQVMPRKSHKPIEKPINSGAFDSTTGYKQEYIKHQLPPRFIREKQAYERNSVPLDGLSNYQKDYITKSAPMRQSCKPNQGAYTSDAPLDSDTTHRVDYQKWQVEKPAGRQQDVWVQPEGNIDFGTTNRRDYDRKRGAPAKALKPIERKGQAGRFEGNPTYKADYRKWETDGPVRFKKESGYEPPEKPFEGQSTHQRDYIGLAGAPRKSMRPVEKQLESGPFDDRTGYRAEYVQHALEPKPPKQVKQYNPNPAALDALTNYLKDYTPKQAEKMQSCRPAGGAYQSNARFEEDTTHKVDYKQWPTERPQQHQAEQYSRPEGEFDFNTTHLRDYTQKPIQLVKLQRPVSSKRAPGQFSDNTTHKEDFRRWGPVEQLRAKRANTYMAPEAAFEGLPTYQSDYTGRSGAVRQSMRPVERGVGSDAPFDGSTMYRTEFIRKEVEPCPALLLETNRTKFAFRETDNSGHKWYEKTQPIPGIMPSPSAEGLQRGLTVA